MSMPALLTEDERVSHAKRALAQFKTMIDTIYRPLLQAVTKNRKLKVEPTATVTATDGKTVFLMVPWVLGETREHDHLVCNKRDEHTLHMLCPACDTKDQIASSVFHESAHITSESFVAVDMEKVRPLVRDILSPYLDVDPDALPAHHKGIAVQAMQVMGLIEKVYLPQIFNIVEDTYVNRRLYEHRAGVEKSMQRLTLDVFTGGFTQGHGNEVKWAERPASAQAAMVAYLMGARLPHLVDHLIEEVHVVRDDKIITDLMESIPGDCPVEARIETAFRVFARFRELGFCVPPSQREPEPEPEPKEPQGEPDPDMPQDPPQPQGDGESEEEGPEGQPGDSSKPEGDGESDDEDDAQSEGSGGDPQESDDESEEEGGDTGEGTGRGDDKDDEADENGEVGLGTEGDDAETRDGDFDEEGDDNLNKGDEAKDGEETEEGGDQDLPGGSGEAANEDGDPMEEQDGSAGQGPTPEELDQQEAKEMAESLGELMGHELPEDPVTEPEDGFKPHPEANDPTATSDLDKAIRWQKFDSPPEGIKDFYEEVGDPTPYTSRYHEEINFDPGTVSGETARLRTVFAHNRKTRMTGSLKSGPRLDVPNLHRIGQDDFRIFGKKDRPGKRDWFVLVGLDDSGSTHGTAEHFIREMGLAVGEMLQGCGVKFAMYGHGGTGRLYSDPQSGEWSVRHLVVKGPDEPWSPEVKSRLKALCRDNTCNYDGHTMEQYRKVIEKRRETDKMILYVTDGKMPMMNFDEESRVLERELRILRQRRVELFGVGYRTDSPKMHGIDTIVVQDGRDLPSLVNGLRERLEK